ncbi:carbohydrate sulfotransferase 11-like isoform X1 [Mya arenaria]|uniref:carbohydrate sulfotransferase 11-like isoform X1 n=1 Tax=Mya arenaria TaxID=6604 RepID=UPI0022E782DF|nr:carbohydrate sulfotransferase 11-like isoform X1 [Mya arenaria]
MFLRRAHWLVRRRRNAVVWTLMMAVGIFVFINRLKNPFTSELLPRSEEKMISQELVPTTHAKKSYTIKDTKNLSAEDGFSRAKFLRRACENSIHRSGNKGIRVSFDPHANAVYCPLCKIASTFWERIFRMMALNNKGTRNGTVLTAFDVPISDISRSNDYLDLKNWTVGSKDATKSFRFMFVRNPFDMLFSLYVDKLVGPNPYFSRFSQANKKQCGYANITFRQLLEHVIITDKKGKPLDCHVAKWDACLPCEVNYTYIGKMETFKDDTSVILSALGQLKSLDAMKAKFTDLHAHDAIQDSVSGPFEWRKNIVKCMSWPDALRRVWRKLQIRGVIGTTGFSLSELEAESINRTDYIKVLKKVREKSTASERRMIKQFSFIEAYRNIPAEILDSIKQVYRHEFNLFNFSDDTEIFRQLDQYKAIGFFNYSNIDSNIRF